MFLRPRFYLFTMPPKVSTMTSSFNWCRAQKTTIRLKPKCVRKGNDSRYWAKWGHPSSAFVVYDINLFANNDYLNLPTTASLRINKSEKWNKSSKWSTTINQLGQQRPVLVQTVNRSLVDNDQVKVSLLGECTPISPFITRKQNEISVSR